MFQANVSIDYRKAAVGITIAVLLATMLFAVVPVALAHPPQSDCANDNALIANNAGTNRAHNMGAGAPAQGRANDNC